MRGRVVTRFWLWGLVTKEGLILSPDWHSMPLFYLGWALGFIPKVHIKMDSPRRIYVCPTLPQ